MESSAETKEEGVIYSQDSFKPGQKFPTPSPGSGDRVFYDTLLRQRPDSDMAQEWCVTHGTLEVEEALQLYKLICKRKNREFDYKSPPPVIVKKSASEKTQRTTTTTSSRSNKIIDETNETIDTGYKFSFLTFYFNLFHYIFY